MSRSVAVSVTGLDALRPQELEAQVRRMPAALVLVVLLLDAMSAAAGGQAEQTLPADTPPAARHESPPSKAGVDWRAQTLTGGSRAAAASLVRLPVFTDDPLSPGTFVKAVHITELRAAINDLRASQGLGAYTFPESVLKAGLIKASHITSLRSAVASTRLSMRLSPFSYTDSAITPRATLVSGAHIRELRNAVVGSWCSLCDDDNLCTTDKCGAPGGCIHQDQRVAVTLAPGVTRSTWQTPNGFVSMYAGVYCTPWEGWYPVAQVPEPRDNYCGPSAGMNLLRWYKDEAPDPAALYLTLGSDMRTNTWDSVLDKAQACACVCTTIFGAWCPACLCSPPDCLAACYVFADRLLDLGTLPEDMEKALDKHTPAGYQLFHGRRALGITVFENLLRQGNPVVVLINEPPHGLHWTLVTGVFEESGEVIVRLANNVRLTWTEFVSQWGFTGMEKILAELCATRGVRPYIWMYYDKTTILTGGQQIQAGQQNAVYSHDGRFMFFLDSVGHLVLYPTPIVIGNSYWHSNNALINNPKAAVMQTDGNLVIYDSNDRAVWSTGTYGHPGAYLAIQNDGNVVIYGPDHRTVLWSTNTCCH